MGSHSFTMTRATCSTCKHIADASKWQSWCTLHSPPFTYKDDRIVRADNSCSAYRADMREDDRWLEGWEREAAE